MVASIFGLGAPEASAQEAKAIYHLFRPTPQALLRDLSTDRPDTTESPFTVDAGRLQVEMDVVSVASDGGARRYAVAPVNLKVGLTSAVDFQLMLEPMLLEGAQGGAGDVTLRAKFNLWGNDEGATALGVMPFLSLPTASGALGRSGVEGGFCVPLAIALPAGFGAGFMALAELVRDDGGALAPGLLGSVTTSRALFGPLAGFVELAGALERGEAAASADAGITAAVGDDAQIDAGVRVGLTKSAEDFALFTGLSFRL